MNETRTILEIVESYNKTATKNEKITNAMNVIFNLAMLSTDSHVEAIGLLECIKLELQESFTSESDVINFERVMENAERN